MIVATEGEITAAIIEEITAAIIDVTTAMALFAMMISSQKNILA